MFHVEHSRNAERLLCEGCKAIGCSLERSQIEKICRYMTLLDQWSRKINLTGASRLEEILGSLVIDSLAGGLALSEDNQDSVLDIGSGAGIPGIPLKIAYPGIRVALIEPRAKKSAFLLHCIGELELENVRVMTRPIQEICRDPQVVERFDKAFLKALKPESVFPEACPLLAETGEVVVFRASPLDSPIESLGLRLDREISYELPWGYGPRVLSILRPIS